MLGKATSKTFLSKTSHLLSPSLIIQSSRRSLINLNKSDPYIKNIRRNSLKHVPV